MEENTINRRRTLPLVFLSLALLSSALACAMQGSETPLPGETVVALTVQAALSANGTPLPPENLPPTQVPPTEVPPTVEISVPPTLTPTATATPIVFQPLPPTRVLRATPTPTKIIILPPQPTRILVLPTPVPTLVKR